MSIPWLIGAPNVGEVLAHEPLRGPAWDDRHTGRWLVVWADRLIGEIVQLRVMGADISIPIDAKQISAPGSWAPVTRRIARCLPVTNEGVPCFAVELNQRRQAALTEMADNARALNTPVAVEVKPRERLSGSSRGPECLGDFKDG